MGLESIYLHYSGALRWLCSFWYNNNSSNNNEYNNNNIKSNNNNNNNNNNKGKYNVSICAVDQEFLRLSTFQRLYCFKIVIKVNRI